MHSSNSKRFSTTILRASVAISMLATTFPAYAVLDRAGPISNAVNVGGYPIWYQDGTGLALELCSPSTQSELAGAWCLLGIGDTVAPEAFPGTYADEHFYYASDASLTPNSGGKALFRGAVEAAFITNVVQGDQIVFSRVRVKLTVVPITGTYRFIHPFGEDSIDADAGDPRGIFFTDDVGIACPPGSFDCNLPGRIGPFLAASTFPGGPELAPVTASNPAPDIDPGHFGGAFAPTAYPGTGKAYLADPARIGPVTGSALPPFTDSNGNLRDHNIFRIEGPPGSALGGFNVDGSSIDFIETTDFSLQGRIFADAIPGRVTVDRASYTRSATSRKLDVFASGFQSRQSRLPAQPRPVPVLPQLSFFTAPCAANAAGGLAAPVGTAQQMISAGTNFWAQLSPATIPTAVCVRDAAGRNALGQLVPTFFQATVADEVTVSQASFDPSTRTLTVKATSSETITPPSLTLDAFNKPLVGGQVTVTGLDAPPAKVRVFSTRNGATELAVTTGIGNVTPPASLTAVNDTFTFPEDSGAQRLNVLANDVAATGGRVTLASQPRLGTATVLADGSVNYTPNANASGADAFTYAVTVGTAAPSNPANVIVNLTPVNDLPTAVNDGPFNVNTGAQVLPSLMENDVDPDGASDIVGIVMVTQPIGATATAAANGSVTFNAAAAGNYTFTYRTRDSAGALSANTATVTVNSVLSDVVVISSALFRTDKKRWVVTGTSSAPNQTISLTYDDGSLRGYEFAQAQVDALGAWTLDIRGVAGNDDPTTIPVGTRPTRVRATSSLTGSGTVTLTIK
jgi:hypothetical protein